MRDTRALQLLIVALAGSIALVAHGGRDAVAQAPPRSQYQLVAGRYSVFIEGRAEQLELYTMFRIDTTTGKTWLYHAATTKDNRATEKWVEISDR